MPWPEPRIAASAAVLLALLAPAAMSQRTAYPEAMSTPALIVVIWERRAPRTEVIAARYGQVQKRNREELLSLLFGGPNPLVANPRSTVIAVYPEGAESFALQAERIRRIEAMTPPEIWASEIPRMVATESSPDAVRGIFCPYAPTRDQLDREIRRKITYPLVGLAPGLADEPGIDESRQRSVNHEAARSVSNPPLVTAWCLQHAASRAAPDKQLLSPVYVIWVHAGERNYAITNPRQRILNDYGIGARDLYVDTLSLYSLLPDEGHGIDGELADGNLVVWRVLPRRAVREPPQADIRIGRMPASFSWDESSIWTNPLRGEAGARAALLRALESMQWGRWSYRVDTPGYTIARGRFRFVRRGATAPLALDGTVDGGLRPFVERAFPIAQTSWEVDDDIVAETLLEATTDNLVPPYLAGSSLRIPVQQRTRPAPISIHISSLHPGIAWAAVALFSALLWAAYAHLRHRFAPRALFASVDFGAGQMDDVVVNGPDTTSVTHARMSLLDRSGFWPRLVRVPLSIELTSPLGDVAMIGEKPLHTFGRSTRSDKKRGQRLEIARRPSRPRSSQSDSMALDIALQTSALDFARLSAGDEVRGVYTVAITGDGPTSAYEPFRQEFGRRFRFRIQASAPQYSIEIIPSEPVRRLGFFGDPESDPESLDRPFGRLVIRNPPLSNGVALTIDAVVRETSCAIDGRPVKLEHTIFANRDSGDSAVVWSADRDDTVSIKNNGVAVYDIFLRLPHGKEWKSRDRWTVRVSATVSLSWVGGPVGHTQIQSNTALWMPVAARSFVCLDLGTSATRLLVQGHEDDQYGYLEFPQTVRPYGWLPEDLPSTAWIDVSTGRVLFGTNAVRQAMETDDERKLYSSAKELILSGAKNYAPLVQLYIEQFLLTFYKPKIFDVNPDRPEVELVSPDSTAKTLVWRGPRHVLIGTVPNEAPKELIETYEKAVERSGLFRRVLMMREAEAAAFGYLHDAAARRPHGDQAVRVLVVDVGAGSTDLALIESTPQELKVLSRSGVQVAGNHVDRAILEALPSISSIDPMELTSTTPEQEIHLLEQARRLKIAMATGNAAAMFETQQDRYQVPLRQLDLIFHSPSYQRAMREIVEEPLLMLVGRAADTAVFRDVDALLLTGRGALMRGVREQLQATLERLGIRPRRTAFDDRRNGAMLKAAVTLGARVFGLGPWSAMTLSSDTYPDRLVFVAATRDGPRCVEIVPPGLRFNPGGVVAGSEDIPFAAWSDARLVCTCLRTDGQLGPDVQLTPERQEAILRRTPIPDLHMRAYAAVGEPLPKRTSAEGPASLSVTVHADGKIDWRFRERPRPGRRHG